jgi:hypothetical protein
VVRAPWVWLLRCVRGAVYPYDEYRRRYGRGGALVEVTVLDAVPDILDLTNKIENATG